MLKCDKMYHYFYSFYLMKSYARKVVLEFHFCTKLFHCIKPWSPCIKPWMSINTHSPPQGLLHRECEKLELRKMGGREQRRKEKET